ncbi:plasmid partitioning protein RepB [Fertoebacter nigrum]|uniref:Plasmid partitioning protein RepB n=1 Tax=Fertoeibacter niger TaxID=2656921 RepID=A0A8X8KQH9_9RHOB|nr:plasmid partitioning protein RepB [Fertoeibacter niger]NUB45981.1 plasmid partitioning protein RepB [Fertoeibacter niger]
MARKNMFEGISPPARPEDAAKEPLPRTNPKMPEVFQSAGPIAAIRNDLRSVASRSVQDIDPDLIEDTGLRDRIGAIGDDIADLRDSIAKHGQQVPILLRPHPKLSGRYLVVYGRRRLAAIKGLGTTVKALIRTLSDEEAVLAQGQENNLRKDPSFLEKALFAGDLEEAGYDARVIQDALNVNRSHTSHMRKVREAFPRDVLERIGAAPSVGWKRWYELAVKVIEQKIDAMSVHPEPFPAGLTSDQRFDAWMKAIPSAASAHKAESSRSAAAVIVKATNGLELGAVGLKKGRLSFASTAENVAFAGWLHQNADTLFPRLHEEFLARSRKD